MNPLWISDLDVFQHASADVFIVTWTCYQFWTYYILFQYDYCGWEEGGGVYTTEHDKFSSEEITDQQLGFLWHFHTFP